MAGSHPWGLRCRSAKSLHLRLDRQLFMFLETVDEFDLDRSLAQILEDPRAREWDSLMRSFLTNVRGQSDDTTWVEMAEIHAVDHIA